MPLESHIRYNQINDKNAISVFKNLSNNFVSIKNPFKSDRNIFQLYPVNIINTKITKKPRPVIDARLSMPPSEEKENAEASLVFMEVQNIGTV